MGKVAFLLNGQLIYWRSIVWAAAVLSAMLMAVALRLWQKKPLPPLLISFPIAIVLSVYCARAIHWYCRFEAYSSLSAALTDLGGGGYSLIGAFVGTLLALLLVRLLQLTKDLPSLLDAVSPAAAFGIALGRWAECFTAADRGKMILEGAAWQRLPWATGLVNAVGASEWRFATFAVQSLCCGLIFLILLLSLLLHKRQRRGDVFCSFLLLYCLSQILLDSTRYDALFLRSNGFVSLVQIVCAVTVAAVTVWYSVRSIRSAGYHWYHGALWGVALLGLGLAGFMEWYVQRHGNRFVFAYAMMALGLLVFLFVPLWLRRSAGAPAEEDAAAVPSEAAGGAGVWRRVGAVLISLAGTALALVGLCMVPWMAVHVGADAGTPPERASAAETVLPYSLNVNNLIAESLEELARFPVYYKKTYVLSEDTVAAPKPDPAAFGSSEDPADTRAVMDSAAELMDGQDFLWSPETKLLPGSKVRWYYDETIVSITWKEVIGSSAYAFSEIKIAHPSQFRRYFADNTFSNPIQYTTSQMAVSVNAVTAMSGDFYKFRPSGTVVYNRTLWRLDPFNALDTCYVDTAGDLHFVKAGVLRTADAVNGYVAENDILYSLSFGPVLIQDGVDVCPNYYLVGEITDRYSRAAICQLGPCHYLLVTVNTDSGYNGLATLRSLTNALLAKQIPNAYTLDGGQTATIYTDGAVFNHIDYGAERNISDIIYFCTAIPEEERAARSS